MYQTDSFGSPDFQFTTSNGIDNSDIRSPIPVPAHAHFNWAFTRPGEYHVTFQSEAEMTEPPNDGTITNGVGTFTFFVPGATNLYLLDQGEIDLEVEFDSGNFEPVVALSDEAGTQPVGNLLVHARSNAKTTLPADAAFTSLGSAGSDFWVLPQSETAGIAAIGIDTEGIATSVLDGDSLQLKLIDVRGPSGGHLAIFQTDTFGVHTVHINSGDGISAADQLPIAVNTHGHHSWGFNKTGNYEVTFTLVAIPAGGSEVESDPFTIQFGIESIPGFVDADGNGIDDHWEYRHGFTSPAVATDDPENDQRNNLREFLHDTYHDQMDSDVTGLTLITATTGRVEVEFQTLEGRQYRLMYSDDLITWHPASGRIIGGRSTCRIVDDAQGVSMTPPTTGRFYNLEIQSPQ